MKQREVSLLQLLVLPVPLHVHPLGVPSQKLRLKLSHLSFKVSGIEAAIQLVGTAKVCGMWQWTQIFMMKSALRGVFDFEIEIEQFET